MKRLLALTLVTSMLLITGCGSTAPEQTETQMDSDAPTSITVAQIAEVANLNPHLYPRTQDSNVQNLIFDTLVSPKADLTFEGSLADSWDISEDGLVYTLHLNTDAKWHDGVDFTADDVIFTMKSLADPTYIGGNESRVDFIEGAIDFRNGEADDVSGLVKIDDDTVQITLLEPSASFIAMGMYISILPEHILGDVEPGTWDKHEFNRSPIGTGKYEYTDWQTGQYIELNINEDYFGKVPNIDTVYYRFGDATTLSAALVNGEVDVVESMGVSELEILETMKGVYPYATETLSVYYVGLNQLNEHFSNPLVRQAFSHALDKETIINTVFGDYGTATDDIFPLSHWSHSENVTSYEYDVEKSMSLLEEAGYTYNDGTGYFEKDGETLHIVYDITSGTQTTTNLVQLLQQYWKNAGISCEIREQDFSTLAFTRLLPQDSNGASRAVTADDFDCYTLGFGIEADPDEYRTYFESSTIPPHGMNFINYANDEIDALFAKSLSITDQDERADVYNEIAEIISEDIAWIPLYCNVRIDGVSESVGNFVTDFRGITFQIEEWVMN